MSLKLSFKCDWCIENYKWFEFEIKDENWGTRSYKEHMIVRRGVDKIFSELYPFWNFFINTKGRYEYALEIAKLLDPKNQYNLLYNIKASMDANDQKQHKNLGNIKTKLLWFRLALSKITRTSLNIFWFSNHSWWFD